MKNYKKIYPFGNRGAACLAAVCAATILPIFAGGPRASAVPSLNPGEKAMSEEKYLGYANSPRYLFLEPEEPPAYQAESIADAPTQKLRGVARQIWAAAALVTPLVQGDVDADDAAESIEAVLQQAGAQVENLISELYALDDAIGKMPLAWVRGEQARKDCRRLVAGLPEPYREQPFQTLVNAALWHLERSGAAARIVGDFWRDATGRPAQKPDRATGRAKIMAAIERELERLDTTTLLGFLTGLRLPPEAVEPTAKKNAPKAGQGFTGRKHKFTK